VINENLHKKAAALDRVKHREVKLEPGCARSISGQAAECLFCRRH